MQALSTLIGVMFLPIALAGFEAIERGDYAIAAVMLIVSLTAIIEAVTLGDK